MRRSTTYTIEDVLKNELVREMHLGTHTYPILDDWDTVMHSVHRLSIEYCRRRIGLQHGTEPRRSDELAVSVDSAGKRLVTVRHQVKPYSSGT